MGKEHGTQERQIGSLLKIKLHAQLHLTGSNRRVSDLPEVLIVTEVFGVPNTG
jgi:hypothetical protein